MSAGTTMAADSVSPFATRSRFTSRVTSPTVTSMGLPPSEIEEEIASATRDFLRTATKQYVCRQSTSAVTKTVCRQRGAESAGKDGERGLDDAFRPSGCTRTERKGRIREGGKQERSLRIWMRRLRLACYRGAAGDRGQRVRPLCVATPRLGIGKRSSRSDALDESPRRRNRIWPWCPR